MNAQFASKLAVLFIAFMASASPVSAASSEDGYSGSDMWLRYVPLSDPDRYKDSVSTIIVENAGKNEVYRHTEDLRMEPGSRETLVETSLEAGRAGQGRRRAAGPRGTGNDQAGQRHPRRRGDRRHP